MSEQRAEGEADGKLPFARTRELGSRDACSRGSYAPCSPVCPRVADGPRATCVPAAPLPARRGAWPCDSLWPVGAQRTGLEPRLALSALCVSVNSRARPRGPHGRAARPSGPGQPNAPPPADAQPGTARPAGARWSPPSPRTQVSEAAVRVGPTGVGKGLGLKLPFLMWPRPAGDGASETPPGQGPQRPARLPRDAQAGAARGQPSRRGGQASAAPSGPPGCRAEGCFPRPLLTPRPREVPQGRGGGSELPLPPWPALPRRREGRGRKRPCGPLRPAPRGGRATAELPGLT